MLAGPAVAPSPGEPASMLLSEGDRLVAVAHLEEHPCCSGVLWTLGSAMHPLVPRPLEGRRAVALWEEQDTAP